MNDIDRICRDNSAWQLETWYCQRPSHNVEPDYLTAARKAQADAWRLWREYADLIDCGAFAPDRMYMDDVLNLCQIADEQLGAAWQRYNTEQAAMLAHEHAANMVRQGKIELAEALS